MAKFPSPLDAAAYVALVIPAALLALDQYQKANPEMTIVPITGWLAYLPIALLVLVAVIWLWKAVRPARTSIEILTPLHDSTVPPVRNVQGSVWPTSSAVQVLVFANDRRWYPQPVPTRDGALWSVQCQLGAADGAGRNYKIVAIAGADLVVNPLRRLPWRGKKSRAIVVTREQ